jgi:hypothetical protein
MGTKACRFFQVAAPGTLILPVAAAHDTVIGAPPAAVLGHKMSLFASALDAQDGMSVSSTDFFLLR